jgi:uncharacterized RDD family membrane protein YckC
MSKKRKRGSERAQAIAGQLAQAKQPLRQQLELASFWPRLAAIIYESFIVMAILFGAAAIPVLALQRKIPPGTIWYEIYLFLALLAYFVYCWSRSGQTIGMSAWRLLLTDTVGKRVSAKRAVLRFFVSVPLLFGLLGILWQWLDPERIALHDRLSKTRVVRLPRRASSAAG